MRCTLCGHFLQLSFFLIVTVTSAIYTLSLHDALPISVFLLYNLVLTLAMPLWVPWMLWRSRKRAEGVVWPERSEEHTSELQSRQYLVCRLLLEKKKVALTLILVVGYAMAAS